MRKSLPNYYQILGIYCEADETAIKNAYRAQAQKTHPDRGGSGDEFRLVREAYEILCDPTKRADYIKRYRAEAKSRGLRVCDECFSRATQRARRCRDCGTYFVTEQESDIPPVVSEAMDEGGELLADLLHVGISFIRRRFGVPNRSKHGNPRN